MWDMTGCQEARETNRDSRARIPIGWSPARRAWWRRRRRRLRESLCLARGDTGTRLLWLVFYNVGGKKSRINRLKVLKNCRITAKFQCKKNNKFQLRLIPTDLSRISFKRNSSLVLDLLHHLTSLVYFILFFICIKH